MQDAKTLILKNILPLVPFDGWSDYTLKEAAKLSAASTPELKQFFPKGAKDCVAFFLEEEDKALSETISGKLEGLKVPQRIEKIILARFSSWLPKREAIKRTVSFHSLPWNSPDAYKALYNTVDLMWKLAGDQSTDFNYYTKRMTLAGVYSSTLLFWLNDVSDNQHDTVEFLKRRLQNVASIGKFKKQLSACFQ